MPVSVKIILYKQKTYAGGDHPIMLDLVKDRQHKRIGLGYRCPPEDWDDRLRLFKKRVANYHQKNLVLTQQLEKAMKIVDGFHLENRDFTLLEFETAFRDNGTVAAPARPKPLVFPFWEDKIRKLQDSKKVGNAKVYRETMTSFLNFTRSKDLKFTDITLDLLENYEVWLRKNGGSDGGISVRIRTLRAVYNAAIKKDLANANDYPFTKYGVNKLKSEGIKKALTRQEIQIIEELDLGGTNQKYTLTRHLFVFSYFTRGMNFADMMKLTWSDIEDNKITYVRAKTKKAFVLKITPPVQEILDFYKAMPSNTNYVFPILLHEDLTPQQEADRKKKVLKRFNKQLKEIATLTGIQKNLSSYVARHSFATNLKHAGVSVTVISESLGHRSQEITETYLKGFENSVIDDAVDLLL